MDENETLPFTVPFLLAKISIRGCEYFPFKYIEIIELRQKTNEHEIFCISDHHEVNLHYLLFTVALSWGNRVLNT